MRGGATAAEDGAGACGTAAAVARVVGTGAKEGGEEENGMEEEAGGEEAAEDAGDVAVASTCPAGQVAAR